jgi:hypothetical protein
MYTIHRSWWPSTAREPAAHPSAIRGGILRHADRTGGRAIRAHISSGRRAVAIQAGLRDDRVRAIAAGAIVASIFVVAALLRFVALGSSDLFRDEAASWLTARYPLDQLLSHVSGEPYPPLYFVILKAWMALFGDGAAAMRTLSALAGLGTIWITWAWSRTAIGRLAAVIAVIVVSVSPLAVDESREARMYALETMFATASWWALWTLLVGGRATRRRTALVAGSAVLAVAGALWTMPTAIGVVGLQAGVIAILALKGNRGARAAAAALALGVVAWLPWLPSLLRSASAARGYWTEPPTLDSVPHSLQILLGGVVASPALYLVPLLLAVAAIGLADLFLRKGPAARVTAFVILGGIALIGAWFAASLVRSAFDARYLGPELPFLAMAIGAGAERLWQMGKRFVRGEVGLALLALLAVLYASGSVMHLDEITGAVAPTRAVVLELDRRVHAGDLVLAVDARTYFPLAYGVAQPDGRSLAAPVRYWRSGREPAYFGGGLIDPADTITPERSMRADRFVLPGLAAGGSIWVVALTNGVHELDRFGPLAAGEAEVVDRIQVRFGGVSAAIFEIRPTGLRSA